MAFVFAYGLDGTLTTPIKDLPLDSTNTPKKSELVKLVAGKIQKVLAAGGAGDGVMDGGEFTGLAGSPYTATNAAYTASVTDTTKYPNGIGKVRMDKASVYKVPVSQASGTITATTANIGLSYAILVNTNDQQVDLNTTTTPSVKVIDFSKDGKFVFVTLV